MNFGGLGIGSSSHTHKASNATYVGRDGLVKIAGENEPRFDLTVTLESLGLLIEESRINQHGRHDFTSGWDNNASFSTGISDPEGGEMLEN